MKYRKEERLLEDKCIIDLYWNRSETAISETDRKYKNLCMHIADNILIDRLDSEECLNDTYLTVWNKIPSQRPKYLSAFLCKIIRNIALKRCEYNTAKKRNPEVIVSLDELDESIPSGDSVEKICDSAELGEIISRFLKKQSKRSRMIFLRRYWYYDSIRGIAENFSMSENGVKQLLFRMRKDLKEYLTKEGF